ncbi:MAG: hypothetical protein EPN25_13310 [Nitrospirae bacterium]|nr:MAG: hypothetical protein EPN25_13310 [Nitrospirota bacterium]
MPAKTVTLHSAQEVNDLWHSSGVHGRRAVIFTRHLNKIFSPVLINAFPEINYLETAMRHGIVRTAHYIVPDRIWLEVYEEILANTVLVIPPKKTAVGFLLLHERGDIHVVPFSEYIPDHEREKALVVIEPAAWTPQEQSRINGFIRSGQLTSDLTVIIGDVTSTVKQP